MLPQYDEPWSLGNTPCVDAHAAIRLLIRIIAGRRTKLTSQNAR